jgi:hypothetical protein
VNVGKAAARPGQSQPIQGLMSPPQTCRKKRAIVSEPRHVTCRCAKAPTRHVIARCSIQTLRVKAGELQRLPVVGDGYPRDHHRERRIRGRPRDLRDERAIDVGLRAVDRLQK